jgi:hypothetical protein
MFDRFVSFYDGVRAYRQYANLDGRPIHTHICWRYTGIHILAGHC